MQPVFRFAPSPNGHLHFGHAYSALLNARLAKERGGRLLLRIEDIDLQRCTDQFVQDCLDDLDWLGLRWERPVLRQSREFQRYRAVALDLQGRGLLYPCFCTRSDIARDAGEGAPRDPDGAVRYPGTCRSRSRDEVQARIAGGEPYAMRLDIETALAMLGNTSLTFLEQGGTREAMMTPDPLAWGDVVLVRKDTPTSYHLAVVLDDAMQGVTHVVRGVDIVAATAVHRVLQALLGLTVPRYHHHALIRDEAGKKLSKSAMSTPLRQMKAAGVTAAEIRRQLGF